MLQSCIGGGSSRCARRALVFVFAWGLVMIAAIQFRHAENSVLHESNMAADDGTSVGVGGYKREHQGLGASRFLLQRSSLLDSSISRDNSALGSLYTTLTTGSERISPITRSPIDLEPLLDKRPAKTEEELIREIEDRLPSLPLAYWNKNSKFSLNQNKNTKSNESGCVAKYPSIYDLEFNNIYWQSLKTSNGTFQLFGAFYDNRKLSRIGPAIRIVGMINRIEPVIKTYCQLWYDGEREPKVVEILEYKYIWFSKWGNYKQGIYQPYVIACKIPQSHWRKGPPASVSLVEKVCDTGTNNLRVIYNKPEKKKDFAVCVKGLDFLHEDLSVRLVEWIELIRLLGADKIFFYELQVSSDTYDIMIVAFLQRQNYIHQSLIYIPAFCLRYPKITSVLITFHLFTFLEAKPDSTFVSFP